MTAVTPLGESSVSPEFTITPTVSGTQNVNLSWSAYPGATTYNIYRSTTAGSELKIASGITTTTYADGGGQTPTTAPPMGVTDTYYYVYWLPSQTVTENGNAITQPTGALKYVFSPASYARMAASLPSGTTPDTASNTQLAPFADSYFSYDSSGRVYQSTVAGQGGGTSGQGTFTYSYSTSGNSAAFNHWSNKAAETLPDSSTKTVYSNYAGEPMLEAYASSSKQWGTFDEFNSNGQDILQAMPSALNLPASLSTLESNADLLHSQSGNYQYLSDDSGEIQLIEYYSSTGATSSTAGGVKGYYDDTKLQQGETATAILQDTRTYFSNTNGSSVTVYPLAAETVYRNTNGTGGETTNHSYTWYSGTNQPQTISVTLPNIPTAENGPNTTDSVVYTLDHWNRATQYQNGDGYISTITYDPNESGGITQTVIDSGTGHLNLTTAYLVSGEGQPTQITDPNGNVTDIVYLPLTHETRVYPGWHQIGTSGTYTTTGPVQITRQYYPAANASSGQQTLYDETLTITPPVESTTFPSGQETVDQNDIQSLSRSLTNAAGQVYETDAYSSLAGLTYSTATPVIASAVAGSSTAAGDYSDTQLGYDSRGRVNHVVDPNGTMTDVTFDGLSRVSSVSQGTNDTTSNNMVDVQDDYYDQRASAPSSATLGQTAGGSLAATTYYVIVTYVSSSGESLGSTEASLAVSASHLLTVTSPTARTGATGYNVYVATSSGQETQQNSSPISIGTNWTEPTGGLVAGSLPPVDQVGDSDLTQVTAHPGGGAADRETQALYDWRDRLVAQKDGVQTTEATTVHRPIYFYTLDNLGEATGAYQYDADGMSLSDFASGQPSADSGKLRDQTLASYDEQQRPYLYQTYEVNQSTGAVSGTNVLSANLFYNNRNDLIAESDPGGLVTKHKFDGADRDIQDSTTDGGVLNGATQNWTTASSTTNDIVLEQTVRTLDSNGNVIETIDRQRFDNDPASSSGEGDLAGPGGGNLASRDYYTDFYYDPANRVTDVANVGTNQGTAWTEPSTPDSPSDSYLLTGYSYAADAVQAVTINGSPTGGTFTLSFGGNTTSAIAYNAPANGTGSVQSALAALSSIGSGNVAVTGGNGGPYTVRFIGTLAGAQESTMTAASSLTGGTSPSVSVVTSAVGGDGGRQQQVTDPRGLGNKTDYDLLGHIARTIAGFSTGVPSTSADQTTTYSDDANGDVLNMTALMPSGTNNQGTAYVYGVGSSGALYSNDLLATIEYPDKTTGQPSTSASNEQTFGYNFLGDETSMTDQNGTTHAYSYDVLSRLTLDSATVATGNPQHVDQSVLSLKFSFDTGGRPYQQTSYSAANGGGSVVNQVTDSYNGFNQLTSQQQQVASGITGTVSYLYNETNIGAENNSRLRSITYPNGRIVDYNYSAHQSPISSIIFSGTTATAATSVAHGLSVGDKVIIEGVTNQTVYDGVFTVATVVDSTHFTYTLSSTPTANASGTDMSEARQGLDSTISRVDGLQDHATSGAATAGTVLEAYTYLGLQTIVQRTHPETGIELTYISQSGDPNPPPSYAATGGDRYVGLDQFGRVDDQFWVNPSSLSSPTDRFQYAYDRDGNTLYKNIVGQGTTAAALSELYHSNGVAENNSYDGLNRLTSFSRGTLSASGTNGSELDTVSTASETQSWSLDALGNWNSVTTNSTTQTRSANGQNQYTSISGATTPTYDNNGNTTKDENGIKYAFDPWNRMASVTNAGGTLAETFGYLAGGQRASDVYNACLGNNTYSYYSKDWQDLEEDIPCCGGCGGGSSKSTYLWGLGYIDDLVERDDSTPSRLYVQQDANWNVTALVGKVSGVWQVVERLIYDSYGKSSVLSPSWASSTDSKSWIFRWQGSKYDAISGLDNFRNRDYSPTLGRFIEHDPAGYVQGANLYQAELGAPISHVDPFGMTAGSGSALDADPSGNGTGTSDLLYYDDGGPGVGGLVDSGSTTQLVSIGSATLPADFDPNNPPAGVYEGQFVHLPSGNTVYVEMKPNPPAPTTQPAPPPPPPAPTAPAPPSGGFTGSVTGSWAFVPIMGAGFSFQYSVDTYGNQSLSIIPTARFGLDGGVSLAIGVNSGNVAGPPASSASDLSLSYGPGGVSLPLDGEPGMQGGPGAGGLSVRGGASVGIGAPIEIWRRKSGGNNPPTSRASGNGQ